MKRTAICAAALLLAATVCGRASLAGGPGGGLSKAFSEAAAYYAAGDFGKAGSVFESLVLLGFESANIYYNLGNCYLKMGRTGEAILRYEKARLFAPRDSALIANLAIARSRMKQMETRANEPLAVSALRGAFSRLTVGETTAVFDAFYYLAAACVLLGIFLRRHRRAFAFAFLVLALAAMFSAAGLWYKMRDARTSAIITNPIVDAKSEPFDTGSSSFPLYEGMKVNLLKAKKGWFKVRRQDGKVGWVKLGGLARIGAGPVANRDLL
jgi:tetratricopeptide (TPR) repeat protein